MLAFTLYPGKLGYQEAVDDDSFTDFLISIYVCIMPLYCIYKHLNGSSGGFCASRSLTRHSCQYITVIYGNRFGSYIFKK